MTALRKPLMSVDEFMAWAERQPEQWELLDANNSYQPASWLIAASRFPATRW